ncbi:MAG: alpha/beta fold hydrolase [Pseudomonadota bacterium]
MERHTFISFDGQSLSYLEAGDSAAPPVLLIHGFISNAEINWVKGGSVDRLAADGWRVIAPDLRAHGGSARPHEDDAYPDDVLALDQHALLQRLDIEAYHLVGYSLGAITAARMIAREETPQSVLLAGMGHGLTIPSGRGNAFVDALTGVTPTSDPFAAMVVGYVKRTKGDPVALAQVMRGRKSVSETALSGWDIPCLILNGVDDTDNGSGDALAAMIPGAVSQTIPGNHMDAIFKPDFAAAISEWLRKQR